MRLLSITVSALAVFAAAIPSPCNSAPQILGLVATKSPVPLSCSDGVCSAEISAVCLQEHRPAPDSGTLYRVTENSAINLVMTGKDGRSKSIKITDKIQLKSLRVYSSVSISLPEVLVDSFADEGTHASLAIEPLASAVPVPIAGDPNPLSAREISDYTGHLRARAEQAIDRDSANLNATRILNQMVNRLPGRNPGNAKDIAKVKKQVLGNNSLAGKPETARLVTRALNTCREKLRVERTPHLRGCLGNQHDILNSNTTQDVWKSLKPGS